MNLTKILFTIGPASAKKDITESLIKEGVGGVRFNFSHGEHNTHLQNYKMVRGISERLKIPVATVMDLQGPKIRVDNVEQPVELKAGDTAEIGLKKTVKTASFIPFSNRDVITSVRKDERILIDDGKIVLKVISSSKDSFLAKVVVGGVVKSHKGLNLPETDLKVPALTEKDRRDLLFGIKTGFDYVALSFVRSPQDITMLKDILRRYKSTMKVIAKIERPEALKVIDEIYEVTDMIMVARGDLGIELPVYQVPVIQKRLIAKANQVKKPIIVATQMLESMMNALIPSRAEVTDISNAVYDGADVVMLSGETASGNYPVETVRMMKKIILEAEAHRSLDKSVGESIHCAADSKSKIHSIANAVRQITEEQKIRCIITFTQSGKTAEIISKYHIHLPIYAFTPDIKVMHTLSLLRGVIPLYIKYEKNTDHLIDKAIRRLADMGKVYKGDQCIITGGMPIPKRGETNFIKVQTI
ncbi:MAG: pyruvate kinase [Deltaproteobacteria bacterium]|nr:pyruvate kinase [Deltaproteobacteria bacterium]